MKAFDVLHARRQMLLVSAAYLFTPLSALSAQPRRDPAQRLLNRLRQLHPGTEFSSVRPTPISSWYEVWMESNVAYVHENHPRYFVFGRLFDAQKAVDLTSSSEPAQGPTRDGSTAIDWSTLPLSDAITLQHGTPAKRSKGREIAVFSDPGCGHCRTLEGTLSQLDDVTVHVFLLPLQGEELPRAIWCSADRAQAWRQWMQSGVRPPAASPSGPCAEPLGRNVAMAQRLGVRGTPTMFFADGVRIEGAATRQVIEDRLRVAAASFLPAGSHS